MRLRWVVAGAGSGRRWLRRRVRGPVLLALALWLGVLALFAVPSGALAAGSVYVVDGEISDAGGVPGEVSQYAIVGGGLLSPLAPPTVAAGGVPDRVVVTPDGRSAYVTNSDGTVSQYNVDPASGTLSPKTPATVGAGQTPIGMAVTPDGKSAYVANELIGSGTISQYNIDPLTGTLSPKTPATVAAIAPLVDVAVTPDGKSAYVTSQSAGSVAQYNIDPVTGALSPKALATVNAGGGAYNVVVTPDGKSAFVTDPIDNTVSQYDIDLLTGALSAKTPATVAVGGSPAGVAVTPDGKSTYVTNGAFDTVSQYNVDPLSGALSPKSPATVAAGPTPFAVAVTADGKNAYVTDIGDSSVSQYNIDPMTGALSPKTPATVATATGPNGAGPVGVAVGPLPAAATHATSTGASCSPRVFGPGDGTVCTATVTDTSASGQSTPTGKVSFTNSGAGTFFGSPCTLSGSGASASCSVFFTAFARGGRIIAAAYGGDATHSASSGFTGVTVAVPASTDGCVVSGHGRITAANGDKASFRGLVAATPPRGVEFYRDNGPASAFRVASTSVDAVACTDDATKASVFGTAKVNSVGSFEYRIDVQLTAWEWGKDTYRIRLSNGYDSGAQQIRHGDVDIRIRDREHQHHDPNSNHYKPGAGQDGG
jgi:DNA-binding beta-propeller fold protein YncE